MLTSTAPVQTTSELYIGYPETTPLHLHIAIGACRLRIQPGDGDYWVRGTYDDPTIGMPYHITQDGGDVRIRQTFDFWEVMGNWQKPPLFNLFLGRAKPFALTLETGASECALDLGGLPLARLELKHGADKMELDFSAPNPQPLEYFASSSGAGSTVIRNLANANFDELKVEGGAGEYVLDFGGILKRDAQVRIETGLAGVEIAIPKTTAAKIVSENVFGSLHVGDGFTKAGDAYVTPAALQGKLPVLSVYANVTFGSAEIRMI